MKKNPDRLLTIKETSELLGVHPNTLRNWDNKGKLKAVRIGTRDGVGDRRYKLKELLKLIK